MIRIQQVFKLCGAQSAWAPSRMSLAADFAAFGACFCSMARASAIKDFDLREHSILQMGLPCTQLRHPNVSTAAGCCMIPAIDPINAMPHAAGCAAHCTSCRGRAWLKVLQNLWASSLMLLDGFSLAIRALQGQCQINQGSLALTIVNVTACQPEI